MLPTSDKSKNDEEKTSTTELIEHMTPYHWMLKWYYYTASQKDRTLFHLSITLAILSDFNNSFTVADRN